MEKETERQSNWIPFNSNLEFDRLKHYYIATVEGSVSIRTYDDWFWWNNVTHWMEIEVPQHPQANPLPCNVAE